MAVYGVAGLIVFMVVGTIMTGNDAKPASKDKAADRVDFRPMVGGDGNAEQMQAQISSTDQSLTQQQSRIAQLEAQLENANKAPGAQTGQDNWSDMQVLVSQLQELRQEINSIKANGTSSGAAIGVPEVDLNAALPLPGASSPVAEPQRGAIPMPPKAQAEQPKIQVVGTRPDPAIVAAQNKKAKPIAYLPAGSVFEGVLLTGMDASTAVAANKTPTPALFRVKSDAILPNHFTQDVKECFVLAGGFGNLSSERAEMRTQTISCVNEGGEVFEGEIEGYLVGEDGKAGIRGRVVSKQGSILANSLMAGFVGGLGAAFTPQPVNSLSLGGGGTQQYQVPSAEYIVGSSVGRGLNQSGQALSQFYISMAQQMFPVIEIDAMRKVSIVLIKGIELRKQEKKV
jgi:conjugal transfer pilus assembly protein TraB